MTDCEMSPPPPLSLSPSLSSLCTTLLTGHSMRTFTSKSLQCLQCKRYEVVRWVTLKGRDYCRRSIDKWLIKGESNWHMHPPWIWVYFYTVACMDMVLSCSSQLRILQFSEEIIFRSSIYRIAIDHVVSTICNHPVILSLLQQMFHDDVHCPSQEYSFTPSPSPPSLPFSPSFSSLLQSSLSTLINCIRKKVP